MFDGDVIYLTMDTHYFDYLQTSEGKKLPVEHCMINTDGWRIESNINDAIIKKAKQGLEIKFIRKHTFGSVEPIYNENDSPKSLVDNINYMERKATFDYIKNHGYIDYIPMEIEMCGFCTDICVISNALILKAHTYNYAEINVDSKCCAGVTPEKHEAALEVMRSCQINVI